ncbi:MAG: DUF4003 family protein [Myxococcales bacterium]|nr:DUF4003 family protein [Myxococcales bacterium]
MRGELLLPDLLALHADLADGASAAHGEVALRVAALTLTHRSGSRASAATRASAARERDEALARRQSWHSALNAALRLALAAQLVRRGVEADAFDDERLRLRELAREGKLRRDECREAIAALLLGDRRRPAPVGPEEVARMRAIYRAMRGHRWFLTGADDLPVIALLVDAPGEPEAIADGIEAIYRRLGALGLVAGDPLQGLAAALYLGAPADGCDRVQALRGALEAAGQPIHPLTYAGLTLLALIDGVDPVALAADAIRLGDRLAATLDLVDPDAFNLGAAFALLAHLEEHDEAHAPEPVARRLLDLELLQMAYLAGIQAAAG